MMPELKADSNKWYPLRAKYFQLQHHYIKAVEKTERQVFI
jgi:hypothetical protein